SEGAAHSADALRTRAARESAAPLAVQGAGEASAVRCNTRVDADASVSRSGSSVRRRRRRRGRRENRRARPLDRSGGGDAGKAGAAVGVRGARLIARLARAGAAGELAARVRNAGVAPAAIGGRSTGIPRRDAPDPAIGGNARIRVAARNAEGIEDAGGKLRGLRSAAIGAGARDAAGVVGAVVVADVPFGVTGAARGRRPRRHADADVASVDGVGAHDRAVAEDARTSRAATIGALSAEI